MLDKRNKEAPIENSTTASKIAIQASAKERRGHKQAQESKQGRPPYLDLGGLDSKQARRKPSPKHLNALAYHSKQGGP